VFKNSLSKTELQFLENKAVQIHKDIINAIYKAGKGHIGGAYSIVEILTCLYYGKILKFNAKDPKWDLRDRFILSKGHAGIALYAVLADLGFFPKEELDHLIKVEREGVKEAIAEARALGDLKENAEYSAAKEKQSHIEVDFPASLVEHIENVKYVYISTKLDTPINATMNGQVSIPAGAFIAVKMKALFQFKTVIE
jgi:hypothetical protein